MGRGVGCQAVITGRSGCRNRHRKLVRAQAFSRTRSCHCCRLGAALSPQHQAVSRNPGWDFRLRPPSPRWQLHPCERTMAGVEIIGQRLEQGPAGPRLASDTRLRISSVILVMVLGRPGIPGLTLRLRARTSAGGGMESRVLKPAGARQLFAQLATTSPSQGHPDLWGRSPRGHGSAKFPARDTDGASGVEAPSTHPHPQLCIGCKTPSRSGRTHRLPNASPKNF